MRQRSIFVKIKVVVWDVYCLLSCFDIFTQETIVLITPATHQQQTTNECHHICATPKRPSKNGDIGRPLRWDWNCLLGFTWHQQLESEHLLGARMSLRQTLKIQVLWRTDSCDDIRFFTGILSRRLISLHDPSIFQISVNPFSGLCVAGAYILATVGQRWGTPWTGHQYWGTFRIW